MIISVKTFSWNDVIALSALRTEPLNETLGLKALRKYQKMRNELVSTKYLKMR
jgi:hypothetical protein